MDERIFQRVVVDLEFDARVSDVPCRAFVYDLSCDGCMIEVQGGQFERGDRVILDFRPLSRVAGRLVWCIGRNCGVQFDQPLHEITVEKIGFQPDPPNSGEPWLRDRFGRPISKPRGRKASSLKL